MRGAQIPPGQPGLATSPHVQEADVCVAGATVSPEELTLQKDFSYDDSEQSDEYTQHHYREVSNDHCSHNCYLCLVPMLPRSHAPELLVLLS